MSNVKSEGEGSSEVVSPLVVEVVTTPRSHGMTQDLVQKVTDGQHENHVTASSTSSEGEANESNKQMAANMVQVKQESSMVEQTPAPALVFAMAPNMPNAAEPMTEVVISNTSTGGAAAAEASTSSLTNATCIPNMAALLSNPDLMKLLGIHVSTSQISPMLSAISQAPTAHSSPPKLQGTAINGSNMAVVYTIQQPMSSEIQTVTSTAEPVSTVTMKTEHNEVVAVAHPASPAQVTMSDDQVEHMGVKIRSKARTSLSKEEKICGVCGDRALGCNFDAISCESCKAFFRRNALKEKATKCLFEGQCEININTRRFCAHCRLQKCFTIGMRRDLILVSTGDNEKKRRMAKVIENRVKRVKSDVSDTASLTGTTEAYSPAPTDVSSLMGDAEASPGSVGGDQQPLAPQLVVPAETLQSSNLLSFSHPLAGGPVGEGIPANPGLVQAASLELCLQRKLTEPENLMLQELVQVYDLSFTVDLEPLIHIQKLDPSLNQLVNQSSITVLRLIKFAKRLEQFVRLPQECQIGILKGTWIHILLLRSVALYDKDRDVWVTPRGDIPTEILKNATGFDELHDDHRCYCRSIKSLIRDDLTIVVLLLVIVLFSPEGPHVAARELVSNIQDKYLILLKHYLESKYTYMRAADMFAILMSKVKELKELAEVHGKYLLDVNPREIEPIMLEILDLK